uniref:Uncharacterized protein n=1 Tax=Rhipicephalus zambeziensis TaxID=60191 RepID=A0A224YJW3_9ACAR
MGSSTFVNGFTNAQEAKHGGMAGGKKLHRARLIILSIFFSSNVQLTVSAIASARAGTRRPPAAAALTTLPAMLKSDNGREFGSMARHLGIWHHLSREEGVISS